MNKVNILKAGKMEYAEALQLQQDTQAARKEGLIGDTLILVEHPPVITLGRRGDRRNILVSDEQLIKAGVSVFDVSRGGDVTYHGPGQIVGYPIIDLTGFGRDIRKFVHDIQQVFIRLLMERYCIEAVCGEGKYSGVWVGSDKIVAIGIAVNRWVTMHGFAFNVNTLLEHFKWILPCGLEGRGVTSLEALTGKRRDMDEVIAQVACYFCEVFGVDGVEVDT